MNKGKVAIQMGNQSWFQENLTESQYVEFRELMVQANREIKNPGLVNPAQIEEKFRALFYRLPFELYEEAIVRIESVFQMLDIAYEEYDERNELFEAMQKSKYTLDILDLLREKGPLSHSELRHHLSMDSKTNFAGHIDRIRPYRLFSEIRYGQSIVCTINTRGERLLELSREATRKALQSEASKLEHELIELRKSIASQMVTLNLARNEAKRVFGQKSAHAIPRTGLSMIGTPQPVRDILNDERKTVDKKSARFRKVAVR